jgi:hypothetical protein
LEESIIFRWTVEIACTSIFLFGVLPNLSPVRCHCWSTVLVRVENVKFYFLFIIFEQEEAEGREQATMEEGGDSNQQPDQP